MNSKSTEIKEKKINKNPLIQILNTYKQVFLIVLVFILFLLNFVEFGFIAPPLISAKSNILVILGFSSVLIDIIISFLVVKIFWGLLKNKLK